MILTFPWKYEFTALIFIMLAVTLSYSGLTYTATLFNHSFFYYLGKCSLVIYLSQDGAIRLIPALTDRLHLTLDRMSLILATVAATAVFSAVTIIGGNVLDKCLFSKKRVTLQSVTANG